jgi:hypothetical protein
MLLDPELCLTLQTAWCIILRQGQTDIPPRGKSSTTAFEAVPASRISTSNNAILNAAITDVPYPINYSINNSRRQGK